MGFGTAGSARCVRRANGWHPELMAPALPPFPSCWDVNTPATSSHLQACILEHWGAEAARAMAEGVSTLQQACAEPGQAVRLVGSGVLADLVALHCGHLEALEFSAGGAVVRGVCVVVVVWGLGGEGWGWTGM